MAADMGSEKYLLLVNLPGETHRTPEEHCGLAFIRSFMERCGVEAQILDAYAFHGDDDYCFAEFDKWLAERRGGERFVGLSPFVSSHGHLEAFGEYVRQKDKDCTIFAGGHYATLNKERLIRQLHWLDAIVVGEGEFSVKELVEKGRKILVQGVYSRGFESQFSPRPRIKDLDVLPWQSRYLTPAQLHGQPFSITTSRGCYGDCSFCSIASFYKCNTPAIRQTFRSAKSVSDEIHALVDNFGIESLKIVDDNFFRADDDGFLRELVGRVEDLHLNYRLSARPNDITAERAQLLKRMGVSVVAIGVESANAGSLRVFRKGIDLATSERAIEILGDVGITCLANFIMFDPVIDIAGLKANCEFVLRHVEDCVFHRINSHLWIRMTDPIVDDLVRMGLCDRSGFPYLECSYRHPEVRRIREIFDERCEVDMDRYYRNADIVMAKGIGGNEGNFQIVKEMTRADAHALANLIERVEKNPGACK